MDQQTIILLIAVVALLVSFYSFYLVQDIRKKRIAPTAPPANADSRTLQLQAYERLVLLAERISLPNLVSRLNQPGLSARDMHLLLLDTIRQEYDYNATQQVYVSQEAWGAIKNLKEQNLLIINQVAATLPDHAAGSDLARRLLEYTMTQRKGELHAVVLEALNFEAKKIM
ncbi:MAG TPA: hypothetical protein PKC69_07985 [Chitinophagaceae bacterium]|nr:hypothetical protein [Chitinophagaceae bacterium]